MMKSFKGIMVSPDATVRETIHKIDASSMQIVLVVGENGFLLGTVTDGDVRRGLLKGLSLESPVNLIMNSKPVALRKSECKDGNILNLMKQQKIHHIPLLDEIGHVIGLETLDELIGSEERPNWVVLMAGGLGTRLRPLTDSCPKPMLKIGSKPILENILENFVECGFRKFFFSVNYMADVVRDHFGDGSRWNIEIDYLYERERMGTAGALSLLPHSPEDPLLVMNGDLLTNVNFRHLLDFHQSHNAQATMCVKEYDLTIPYGVVKVDSHCIIAIDEKPMQRFFVNAGIYVLNPEVLEQIPGQSFFDMPSLFQQLIDKNASTAAFPIREYWLDIGQIGDLERAQTDFGHIFCSYDAGNAK